jgi:hypothetical protein
MKKIVLFLFIMGSLVSLASAQLKNEFVEVLYFHRTNRCHTCLSIEKVTSDMLNKDYAREIKSGDILFTSIDYQVDSTNLHVKKYTIEGPTLLIVYHNKKKDSNIDLTDLAFENAVSNPSVLRKEIAERIDGFFR